MASIPEILLKSLGGFGITEFQKNRLTKKALEDGELIALIPCSIKESGLLGWQSGLVAITRKSIIFGQKGKSTQLGLKLRFSWFQKFPILNVLNYKKEYKEHYLGMLKVYHFAYSNKGKKFELIFNVENAKKFEESLIKVK